MPPGLSQFTPRQLLDAGRRAEADGKLDLAYQFYGHLSHYYGYTAEGTEGRHALARIGKAGHHPQLWQMNGEVADAAGSRPAGRPHRGGTSERRPEYRLGRALAALLSGMGWLTIAGALLTLATGLAEELGLAIPLQAPWLGRSVMFRAAGALLAGAFALLAGQALRALFDQASAARELVALERQRADGHDPR
jgi:hypothetical protein